MKRVLLVFVSALVLIALISACAAPTPEPTKPPAPAPTQPPAPAPTQPPAPAQPKRLNQPKRRSRPSTCANTGRRAG